MNRLDESFRSFLASNGLDASIYKNCENIPRYIRINPRMPDTTVSDLEVQLGTVLKQVDWLPHFYSFPDSVGIAGSDAYKKGRIYGLDAASGAAVIALDPKPGHHVLDLCAAPGAKLCMIGDLLDGRGSVTGVDVSRDRIATCRTLITKYKISNCRLYLCDGTNFASGPPICLNDERHSKVQLSLCEVPEGEARPEGVLLNVGENQHLAEEDTHRESTEADFALQDNSKSQHAVQQSSLSQDSASLDFPSSEEMHANPSKDPCAPLGAARKKSRRNPCEETHSDLRPFYSNVAEDVMKELPEKHAMNVDSTPLHPTQGGPRDKRANMEGGTMPSQPFLYDRVLVDAECTHDGSIKHLMKYDKWGWDTFERRFLNPERINTITQLQRQLLTNGLRLLRPGGRLVYSTCSFTRAQNEEVVQAVVAASGGAVQVVPCLQASSWPCHTGSIEHTLRFEPRAAQTSGLFVACIEKLL
mmetsp:Transcript_11776/g.24709  ORF Transcript_11776/g.24709 Transcript_11776/m.24709 type:complete len:472 (-) Transcript_11776:52-1467(-)|eukprot:CAMPEP_0118953952 /NCGR_PEP_ID=MMETSP1169-20130426/57442_1 /TAXON_ID=36882 /ORGANISM="Pyramimonas obovata, Strain CCMP722" /LENGTH=471 /DNA_ID=CAMNT_0006901505 /DNA_START=76 /DNA_END=1491 /DNA_ORIENTATION=+